MQPKNSDSNDEGKTKVEEAQRYLLFVLGGETYGTPLNSIKEVIKPVGVKAVPYMVNHFKGVINLRGQIVSIVDMREKFSLKFDPNKEGIIMVVETPEGLLGAIVDELVSVQVIENTQIDRNAMIETKIDMNFFLGVAKQSDSLVNLIDLARSLGSEDFRQIRQMKRAG